MMTGKENFLAALRNENPEWIPWAPLIDSANIPCFVDADLHKNGLMDLADLGLLYQKELRCDILLGDPVVAEKYRTATVSRSVDGSIFTTKIEIQGHTLTQKVCTMKISGMNTSAVKEYFLKDEKDLLIFDKLLDDTYLEYEYASHNNMVQKIGDKGIVTPIAPRTPIMQLIIELMGIENFTYTYEDAPELLDSIMQKMHRINLKHYEMILNSGLEFDFIRMHEDQDILLTSPDTYKKYILPMMKEYCDMVHAGGKGFMMHACGHIKPFLQMILDTGIDAHHYLTDAPVGDTSSGDAKAVWGDKICIMAAVDPLLQAVGTAEEVRSSLLSILDQLKGGSFVVMSALKPEQPEENIRIIQKTMAELNGFC